MEINFFKEDVKIKSITAEGKVEESLLEIRYDPLIEHKARINLSRIKRPHVVANSKAGEEEKHKSCIFCKENWDKFLQRFYKEKKFLVRGDCALFPNKYPFGKDHTVLILTGTHELKINRIPLENWENAFSLIHEHYVERYDDGYVYVNMNFLYPSGASIEHPHLQILYEEKPLIFQSMLLNKSRIYFDKTGEDFWISLCEEEKRRKERFIGELNNFIGITAFAPLANKESIFICKKSKSFFDLNANDIKDFSKTFSYVVSKFLSIGAKSFNATVMFPSREETDFFSPQIRIIMRPEPKLPYTCDRAFMEVYHREPVISFLPEDVAKEWKKVFKTKTL